MRLIWLKRSVPHAGVRSSWCVETKWWCWGHYYFCVYVFQVIDVGSDPMISISPPRLVHAYILKIESKELELELDLYIHA